MFINPGGREPAPKRNRGGVSKREGIHDVMAPGGPCEKRAGKRRTFCRKAMGSRSEWEEKDGQFNEKKGLPEGFSVKGPRKNSCLLRLEVPTTGRIFAYKNYRPKWRKKGGSSLEWCIPKRDIPLRGDFCQSSVSL